MAGGKKKFPCGHTGKGQYCHQCAQLEEAKKQKAAERMERTQEREAWQQTFDQDVIDLRKLPPHLVLKARKILADVCQTKNYIQYKGKRLNYDRTMISIPLSREYRLMFQERDGTFYPLAAMSHEDYNGTKPGAG